MIPIECVPPPPPPPHLRKHDLHSPCVEAVNIFGPYLEPLSLLRQVVNVHQLHNTHTNYTLAQSCSLFRLFRLAPFIHAFSLSLSLSIFISIVFAIAFTKFVSAEHLRNVQLLLGKDIDKVIMSIDCINHRGDGWASEAGLYVISAKHCQTFSLRA